VSSQGQDVPFLNSHLLLPFMCDLSFYELGQLAVVAVAPVAAMLSYIHQFSSLFAIWLYISSFVASFLIYIHSMDTIIRPISRKSRTSDNVSVL
jgi:hypothetical protein